MTDQEILYRAADRLSHDTLTKFLEANNMDKDKYMKHRIHLMALQPASRVTRAVKAKMLRDQDNRCAFCHDPIPHGCSACYDRYHNDVVCRRCLSGVNYFRVMLRAGLTLDMIQKRVVLIKYIRCGSCEQYHQESFTGDCRNDAERFTLTELLTMGISGNQIVQQLETE